MSLKKAMVIFFALTVFVFACIGHKNLIQAMVIYLFPITFALQIFVCIILFRSERYGWIERILNLSILFVGARDMYSSHIAHTGLFHLSTLSIILSCIKFINVLRVNHERELHVLEMNKQLESEVALVGKLSGVYEIYRQIVHDIKSPITALNFFLSSETINTKAIKTVKGQVESIIGRINGDEIRQSPDWYSIGLLVNNLDEVLKIKAHHYTELSLSGANNVLSDDVMIFFDPIDMKVIFNEVVDNSFKSNPQVNKALSFVIESSSDSRQILIRINDNGPGIPKELRKSIAQKGSTIVGTGMGLYSIKSKVESWNGYVEFDSDREGFSCKIILKAKKHESIT